MIEERKHGLNLMHYNGDDKLIVLVMCFALIPASNVPFICKPPGWFALSNE